MSLVGEEDPIEEVRAMVEEKKETWTIPKAFAFALALACASVALVATKEKAVVVPILQAVENCSNPQMPRKTGFLQQDDWDSQAKLQPLKGLHCTPAKISQGLQKKLEICSKKSSKIRQEEIDIEQEGFQACRSPFSRCN